jgi:ribosomal protein S18 acetylase RimI-like enzyme
MGRSDVEIVVADRPPLIAVAKELMGEYAAMPHTIGRWNTAAADIAALPEPYVAPLGALVVAFSRGEPVGCGGVIAYDPPAIAELKRVYVRPSARGLGLGEAITRDLLGRAAAMGFARVRLDTAPELLAAQTLYRKLGFAPIPLYRETMLPNTLCFEVEIDRVPPPAA